MPRTFDDQAEMPPVDLGTVNPQDLARDLFESICRVAELSAIELGAFSVSDIIIERPKNREHGDWATGIALKLAKAWGANPRELAVEFAADFSKLDGVADVEVAGPGFINVRLDASAAGVLAQKIVEAGGTFGNGGLNLGGKLNL